MSAVVWPPQRLHTPCGPVTPRKAWGLQRVECEHCGKVVWRVASGGVDTFRYCSRPCYDAAIHESKRKAREVRQAAEEAKRKPCQVCGMETRNKRTCGASGCQKEAKRRAYVPKPPRVVPCVGCSIPIAVRGRGSWRVRCEPCRSAARKTARQGMAKSHTARAKAAGVPRRHNVRPSRVFQRDGWRCQLCGQATPRRLKGTTHDNAPEIDHIVPLALGGGHTYDNVQCCCRRCNGRKGGQWQGQTRLPFDFGAVTFPDGFDRGIGISSATRLETT